MQSSPATFSDPVHDLRYRIADLLANIEAENAGLDARTATLALVETAYGAALTFCATPERARRHVGDAVATIHAGGSRSSSAKAPRGFGESNERPPGGVRARLRPWPDGRSWPSRSRSSPG